MAAQDDHRNHLTLVLNEHREKLSRVDENYSPAYISTAQRCLPGQLYDRELERCRTMMASGKTHLHGIPLQSYAEKFARITPWIAEAWYRHLDMGISKNGEGRKEIIAAITRETGQIMPGSYHAPGTIGEGVPVVNVINNPNGDGAKKPHKEGIMSKIGRGLRNG